jgi:putative membrane protein
MKRLMMVAFAPAFALGACGGGHEAGTSGNEAMGNVAPMDVQNGAGAGDNAMLTGEAGSPAQAFADAAGASDFYEIEAGKLAQEKAQSPALKDFGKMMVENHTASTEKLKAAGAKADPAIVPNPALTAEQEANLATLRAATGTAFDDAYKGQQIAAHQQALSLIQGYAATGEVPSIKAWASETQKVVQGHLDKIKTL